jgi:hypothetical protein
LIAAPPLLAGAIQDSFTLAFKGVAVGDRGADGAVAAATSAAAPGAGTWAGALSVAADVTAVTWVVVGAFAAGAVKVVVVGGTDVVDVCNTVVVVVGGNDVDIGSLVVGTKIGSVDAATGANVDGVAGGAVVEPGETTSPEGSDGGSPVADADSARTPPPPVSVMPTTSVAAANRRSNPIMTSMLTKRTSVWNPGIP